MKVNITCDHCNTQFDFEHLPYDDSPIIGECEWCGSEICEDCKYREEGYHESCHKDMLEQEEETE